MNSLKSLFFTLTLTMLIITSCILPRSGLDPAVSIKNITPGDSSLTITLQAREGIVVTVFVHKEKDYSDQGIKEEISPNGLPQEVVITGLTNGTPYYILIKGENEKGTIKWTEPEGKTSYTPRSSVIEVNAAGAVIKDGAITVTASTATGLILRVSAFTAADFSGTSIDKEAAATGTLQEITLDGLVNDTPYYLRVQAKKNETAVSDWVSVPDGPYTPLDHSVSIEDVVQGSGKIIITAVSGSPGVSIKIEASRESDFTAIASTVEETGTGSSQSITAEGLAGNISYYLRVRGESSGHTGSWVEAPSNPYLTSIVPQINDVVPRNGQLTVDITAPLGMALTLEISDHIAFGNIIKSQQDTGSGIGGKTITITGLTNNLVYYVRLKIDDTEDTNIYSTPLIPAADGKQYIHRLSELAKIGLDTNNYPRDWSYELRSNLSFSDADNNGTKNDPFDTDEDPDNGNWTSLTRTFDLEFSGTFDGGGFTIDGMTLIRSDFDTSANEFLGFFGRTKNSVIKDIGLSNIDISGGSSYIGGLAGDMSGTTKISNSFITGELIGLLASNLGGMAGQMAGTSTITNSYASGIVKGSSSVGILAGIMGESSTINNSYARGESHGSSAVGGLAGSLAGPGTIINNSYADAFVESLLDNAGGLIGILAGGTITNSYALGDITAATPMGGLVGSIASGTITNSYRYSGQTLTEKQGGSGSITQEGTEVNSQDLARASWYRSTLGWGDIDTTEWQISGPVAAGNSPLVNKEGFTTDTAVNLVPGQTGP